jgi:hypothetical protein
VDDLVFLGAQSEEQLWDCLTGPQVPNSDDRIILPPECELTAEEEDLLSDFVTRLRSFARNRNIFYSEVGVLGRIPRRLERETRCHVAHECSLPVLLREGESKIHHLGM